MLNIRLGPHTLISKNNIIMNNMLGMISRSIGMIGIWIVLIYGMPITFIFYLMIPLHLM
jgi:hypothetical protein